MDKQLLQAIVRSREEVMRDVENPEDFDKSLNDETFPPTDRNVLATLTRSFTDLISYKVSQDACQRYNVRINLIEVLRDWIRPPREIETRTFFRGERVLDLVERILAIYLTNDTAFGAHDEIDIFVGIANALITLSTRNKKFLVHSERLLQRIAVLEQTESSRGLLLAALKQKDVLELGSRTVERLYIAQSPKLVEEPLIDNFIENLRDSKDIVTSVDFRTSRDLDKLLIDAAVSPSIFQISSGVLKELFVSSNYSPKVSSYIEFFLKSLDSHCREQNQNILDLYPLRLQSCVLLLDIEPARHTSNSRLYVLNSLENLYRSSTDETLILVSHFPKWLELFSKRLVNYSKIDDSLDSTITSLDD